MTVIQIAVGMSDGCCEEMYGWCLSMLTIHSGMAGWITVEEFL